MSKNYFNEDIFNQKYEKYSSLIFKTAYQYILNKDFAEDVMQDVFIKLLVYEKPFKDNEHEKAWIIRVTINNCKNLLKSKAYNSCELIEAAQSQSSFEAQSDNKITIENELKKLSSEERTIIYLFYFEGYTSSQISGILKMNESTVKSHLKRARSKMKNNIERQD